ncbi:MAG: hypothetical protein AAGF84_05580 [Planctomycetota bacterium]
MIDTAEPPRPAPLPDDVQAKLEAHLDAVDAVLVRYGQNRSQRAAITDELDGQLRDMLAARCEITAANVEDAEAVLAEVEPPEAFARRSIDLETPPAFTGFAEEEGPPPKTSGWAIAGLVCVVLGSLAVACSAVMVLMMLFGIAAYDQAAVQPSQPAIVITPDQAMDSPDAVVAMPTSPPVQSVGGVMLLFLLVAMLLPTLLFAVLAMGSGLTAMGRIKAAPRHVGGWGLAVFDVVYFPFWLFWLVSTAGLWVGLFYAVQAVKLISGKMNVFEDGWEGMPTAEWLAWGPVALLLGLGLTVGLTWFTVRRLNAWRAGQPSDRRPFPLGVLSWLCFGLAVGLIAVALSGVGDGENYILPAIGVLVLGVFLGVLAGRRGYGWFAALACALGAGVLLVLR